MSLQPRGSSRLLLRQQSGVAPPASPQADGTPIMPRAVSTEDITLVGAVAVDDTQIEPIVADHASEN